MCAASGHASVAHGKYRGLFAFVVSGNGREKYFSSSGHDEPAGGRIIALKRLISKPNIQGDVRKTISVASLESKVKEKEKTELRKSGVRNERPSCLEIESFFGTTREDFFSPRFENFELNFYLEQTRSVSVSTEIFFAREIRESNRA